MTPVETDQAFWLLVVHEFPPAREALDDYIATLYPGDPAQPAPRLHHPTSVEGTSC